jgi:hypothetical protein
VSIDILDRTIAYNKLVLWGYCQGIDSIEAFRQCWRLQFPKGTCNSRYRNLLLSFAQIVSPNRVMQRGGEKVGHDAKANCSSRLNISCAIAWQRIRIVDDERLSALQASREQELFSMPRPQHVQTDANVGVEEMLAVEGSLPGTLNSNENYGFHGTLQTRRVRSLSGALWDFWQPARPGAMARRSGHGHIRQLNLFALASQQ